MKRRVMLACTAVGGVMLVAAPLAARPDDAATAATKVVKPVKEKMICRRQEVTGSMFSTTICHSKAEWEAIAVANQAGVDRLHAVNGLLPGQQLQ